MKFIRTFTLALMAGVSATAVVQQASSAETSPSGQVETIVVTAERRAENLQDVPSAVSVVSGAQLKDANYAGLTNLQFLVPSVQFNSYLGGGFQVRGVGTQTVNLTTEQDVGIVVDDVIQGAPQLTFATPSYEALTDVARIEALKGPQGTLFGKNSSVGVIQVVTEKPDFSGLHGDGSASFGSGGEERGQLNVNIPLSDTVAARFSVFEYHHDGFITNVVNGNKLGGYDHYGVRGKLLWQPSDDFGVYLIGEHMQTDDPGDGAWTIRQCGSGFFVANACASDIPLGVVPGPTNNKVALDAATPARTVTNSGSLHIDYNIFGDTLTSVTALLSMNSFENVDADNSPRPILSFDQSAVDSMQFTQELRLTSPTDQFVEYTIGAYYYNLQSMFRNVLAGTFGFLPDSSTTLVSNGFAGLVPGGQTVLQSGSQSFALFGQGTVHVSDKFSVIGGLRFTHDNVHATVHVEPFANICEFGFAFGGPCHSVSLPSPLVSLPASASNVSGKVTAKYQFTDTINAYASFATGYKGPAISYAALTPFSKIKPETSRSYEIGIKSELFDRTVVLNADVFYEKFTNFQADTFVFNASNPAASNFEAANAGGLESKGIEADVTWMANDNLTLRGNVAYNPTKFTDFVIQCLDHFTNPGVGGACFVDPASGRRLFNAKGFPLPQSPETAFTLSADYTHPVWDGFVLDANANFAWRSRTYSLTANPNTIQKGYGLLGLNVAIGPESGSWRLSVFARNLADQKFVSAIFPTFLDDGSLTGNPLPTQGYTNVPNIESRRTIGVKLDLSFGP